MEMSSVIAAVVLAVRVYDGYGVAPEHLRAARAEADLILRHAGIDVAWIDCSAAQKPRCDHPPGPDELILRIPARGQGRPVAGRYVPMGDSLVNEHEPRGARLATVYMDRVSAAAHAAGVSTSLLLGRSVAHEIGHLLLNHGRHSRRGLMRANWSSADLRRSAPGDWRFIDEDAVMMRAAIAGRLSSAAASRSLPADATNGNNMDAS